MSQALTLKSNARTIEIISKYGILILFFLTCTFLYLQTNKQDFNSEIDNHVSTNSVGIFGLKPSKAATKNAGSKNQKNQVNKNLPTITADTVDEGINAPQNKNESNDQRIGKRKNTEPGIAFFSKVEYSLSNSELPALASGMTNVTDNEKGYHIVFSNKLPGEIIITFDPRKIPEGYTVNDIFTYTYDSATSNWTQLRRDGVDFSTNKIHSTGTKDGEFINAIIKTPEASETQGYAPTTMSDIKVGDPASMVQVIQPPSTNNQGTANLNFHIETPIGRQGIQPNLNIAYSSDGGNGWLGEGWSLNGISTITVDTRWGRPQYAQQLETETYLLDGQMLAYKEKQSGKTPNRFTSIKRSDVTNDKKTLFTERKQNNFSLIERIGDKPENYYWLVTDKNGTKYFYGWDIKNNIFQEDGLIRRQNGSKEIAEWKLVRVEDVWGNYMTMNYLRIEEKGYVSTYPSIIEYTKHLVNGTLSFHRVTMAYSDTARSDNRIVNARYGVALNPNARRLEEIKVERILDKDGINTQLVRKYFFSFRSGAFGKTLLAKITQHGDDGKEFNAHQFNYFNEDESEKFYTKATALVNDQGLTGSVPDPLKITNNKSTAIGASTSSSNSTSAYFGVGSGNPASVNISGGIQYNNSSSSSQGLNTLIDIDGDGRPDKVFVKGSSVQYEKNISEGSVIKFDPTPIKIEGISRFSEESSRTTGWGARVNFGVTVGYDNVRTETNVSTYFSDVNGDGLIDLVKGGTIYFNTGKVSKIGINKSLVFSLLSSNTPVLINGTGTISTAFVYDNSDSTELITNNPLQEVVKVWEAPFNGTVDIEAPVKLLLANSEKQTDGVWVAIEHKAGEKTLQIKENDDSLHYLTMNNVQVIKGDKIFFRLQSGRKDDANGANDRVLWNPSVSYVTSSLMGMDTSIKDPAIRRYSFKASNDFLVSNQLPIEVPEEVTTIKIGGKFSKGVTMDSVTIEIVQLFKDSTKPVRDANGIVKDDEGKIVYEYSFDKVLFDKQFGPEETTSISPLSTNLSITPLDRKLQFIIKSHVNIDIRQVVWEPMISYEKKIQLTDFDINNTPKPGKDTSTREILYPVPYYVFNDTLRFANARYDSVSVDTILNFHPSISITNNNVDSSFWFVVKSTNKVLGKKLYTFESGRLKDATPLRVNIGKGDPYIVGFEAIEAIIGKQKDEAYQKICNSISSTDYFFKGNIKSAYFHKLPINMPNVGNFYSVVPFNGNYKIIPELSVQNDSTKGKVIMQVWVNNKRIDLGSQDSIINYRKNIFTYPLNHISLSLKANDKISVQFIYPNDTLNNNPTLKKEFSLNQFFPAEFWLNRVNQTFGTMYKGWGQFVYNGMGTRSSQKIDPTKLRLPDGSSISNAQIQAFKNNIKKSVNDTIPIPKDANFDKFSAANTVFAPMIPCASEEGSFWLGTEDSIYLKPNVFSTSRLGIDDVKSINPFSVSTTAVTGTDNSFGRGITKVSKSKSNTYSGGALMLTGSYTDGSVEQVSDFSDMNGDRFPDIINGSSIQLTDVNGTLGTVVGNNYLHKSGNKSAGVSVSGSSGRSKPESGAVPGKGKQSSAALINSEGGVAVNQSAGGSIGASGAYNDGEDNVSTTWADINGDGLPDKVNSTGYDLNLGYGEYQRMNLTIGDINKAQNLSLSPGVTAGFSIDKNSFSGGAGLSFSGSKSKQSVQDMNGDGLPDIVNIGDNGDLTVAINTGRNFSTYPAWSNIAKGESGYGSLAEAASFPIGFLPRNPITSRWFNMEKTKFNSSNGVSIGGSYTYGFAIPIPPLKFVFNAGFNHSEGIGRTIRQIIDMNADGYPDIVYSSKEGQMDVWLSNLGKTNKLREVANPLGGSFEINYRHTDVTEDHPGGKWVMSELTLNDGIVSDRADTTCKYDSKKTFAYSGGKQDRYEREFLGFEKSITTDVGFDDQPYRELISKYDISNYYSAGHLIEVLLRDAKDTLKRYTITRNDYYKDPISSVEINMGTFKREVGIIFPLLKSTTNGTFEASNTVLWQNKTTYTYNKLFGYVKKFVYKESPTDEFDNSVSYQTTIAYELDDLTHYLIGRPKDVLTQDNKAKILRHVGAEYYKWSGDIVDGLIIANKGKLRYSLKYLDGSNKTVTDYRYDKNYGNVAKIIMPNQIAYKYDYDKDIDVSKNTESRTETYVTKVTNESYKFSSETFYDYRYGIVVRSKDINDNSINYKLDHFGRIVKVIGPKECQTTDIDDNCPSGKYTVNIDYSMKGVIELPNSRHPIAKINHFDYGNPGIETINFIDGLNRSIQVKKTASIANLDGTLDNNAKWVVTGRINLDAFGRQVSTYYPTVENTNGLKFIETINPNKFVTTYSFDVADRLIQKTLPDTLEFSTIYSKDALYTIAKSIYYNKTISGGDQKREVYTNGSGLKAKDVLYDKTFTPIPTQYFYDGIHQLEKVIDAGERVTRYTYNHQGNKILLIHPDAGSTQYRYNNAGQLSHKITANNDDIEYIYKLDRLTQIKYPRHPENNVLYVFSNDKMGNNSRNKLVYQEDASGAQSFEYGELGEITKSTRTIIVPFSSKKYTFTTSFSYDTWNRLKSITYPDNEEVTYTYNNAGLLSKISGKRDESLSLPANEKTKDYVSALGYDEFEQRIFIKYGNETRTTYAYQKDRRRIAEMKVNNINTASSFFNAFGATFNYDNQNNITSTLIKKTKGAAISQMQHTYIYDNLNRVDSAFGDWTNGNELADYRLGLEYDGMFNITSKNLSLSARKNGLANPVARTEYVDSYMYDDKSSHHLTQLNAKINRNGEAAYAENNLEKYAYDKNGNNILKATADRSGNDNVYERRIDWDEENRINAVSMNGIVSHYVYDANGDRTIKLSKENLGVFVNGKFAGDTSATATFSLYANPYFSMRNSNGIYTKHIFIGTQLIVSQVENEKGFSFSSGIPERVKAPICPLANCTGSISYENRKIGLNKRMNHDFEVFDLPYEPISDTAFQTPPAFRYAKSINPYNPDLVGNEILPGITPQLLNYYYHSNQVGSTSFITDDKANVVQCIEYLPFGETFMEQRQNYSSQFLFNSKEQDQETGLYYYGARYYDPHTYQWLGVDPMAEKYPDFSPYNFCLGNPVKIVDPNGKESEDINEGSKAIKTENLFFITFGHYKGGEGKDLNIRTESLDFSGLSKGDIKNDKGNLSINTLDGGYNSTSLALGKVELIHIKEDTYKIKPDLYDFNIETQNGFSRRNVLTALGFIVHNLPEDVELKNNVSPIRPQGFTINFHGTIKIPEKLKSK